MRTVRCAEHPSGAVLRTFAALGLEFGAVPADDAVGDVDLDEILADLDPAP